MIFYKIIVIFVLCLKILHIRYVVAGSINRSVVGGGGGGGGGNVNDMKTLQEIPAATGNLDGGQGGKQLLEKKSQEALKNDDKSIIVNSSEDSNSGLLNGGLFNTGSGGGGGVFGGVTGTNTNNINKVVDDHVKTSTDHSFSFGDYDSDEFDENYDEAEINANHYPDKILEEDHIDYKSGEYEERQLGPILDTFDAKFDEHGPDGTLPLFLQEPQSTFVVRSRPAYLKCKVAHALQVNFKCTGTSQPPPSTHESHVDPHTGVHLEEVIATISRDLVDEYFGKGPFRCECHAWSSRGIAKSQVAAVEVAYIRKQFSKAPTSVRVELGGRAELQCGTPNGLPTPKLTWYKNNVELQGEHPVIITPEGSLHVAQVTLQDMANYTCVAENVAGKRTSDPVTLTVYVDGGWSGWSPWMECKCPGKPSQGQKRTRSCSNPIPLNGGLQCEGPNVQKTPDCISCPEDTQIVSPDSFEASFAGRWSPWSEWSSCSVDCIQIRRRKCISHTVDDGLMGGSVSFNEGYDKSLCSGKDFQTAECRGGNCHIGKSDSDWPLYLGLTVITAVCIALGAALVRTARRGRHVPPYNMTRTVMQSEYLHDADKKTIHFHNDAATANYEYPASRPLTGNVAMTRSISEHHYDVPNLASNYTTPIDGLSSKYSYATDTADTSTNTSDSTYDVASEPPTLPMPPKTISKLSTTREVVTSIGGFLRLYKGMTMLYVPDSAVAKNLKHTVSLSILTDECSRIITSDQSTYLSPVVYCGPIDLTFQKAIVLKIPHCMVDPSVWVVNIYYSDSFIQESNVKWRKIATLGEETLNTPIFVHVDKEFACIMTEQLGRFVIVGEPLRRDQIASKKMKLIVFGHVAPGSAICSLRVYVVDDFPNCRDSCARVEGTLGGIFMGESPPFVFHLNSADFNVRLNCVGEWQPAPAADTQVIPYDHMLNSSSILHCEFLLQRTDQSCIGFKLEINYSQSDDVVDSYMFVVPYTSLDVTPNHSLGSNQSEKRKMTIMDRDGTYITEAETELRLPRNTKRAISNCLDPPRSDGHDWRLLASLLNVDRYIAYFATKQSPTEQILNLWECRNRTTKAIVELITVFKEMNRQDVVDVIEQSVGPLWF